MIRALWFFILAAGTLIVPGHAADNMKTVELEVCGAAVSVDLHPNAEQPQARPRNVNQSHMPGPADMADFLHAMYDYRGSRKLDVDGSVVVEGFAMRRSTERRDQGISCFDIDRMMKSMAEADRSNTYEKVERKPGVFWIKRSHLRDVPAGKGRTIESTWLVPVTDDIMLFFRVSLVDYGTSGTGDKVAWYQDAQSLQKRISDSLRVDVKRSAAGAGTPKKTGGEANGLFGRP